MSRPAAEGPPSQALCEHDRSGALIRSETAHRAAFGDPIQIDRLVLVYDACGRLTVSSRERCEEAAGCEITEALGWRYDLAGNLALERVGSGEILHRYDATGRVETRWTAGDEGERFTYRNDAGGRLVEEIAYSSLAPGQPPARRTRFSWSADTGRLERVETDLGADGIIDVLEIYDPATGQRVRQLDDADGDGGIDRTQTWAYDPLGRLLTQEQDDDADGQPDRVWTYRYEDGRLVETTDDLDGDGQPEWIDRRRYENGRLVERSRLRDGALFFRARFEYDAAGRQILEVRDEDGDGRFDRQEVRRYEDGRLVEQRLDSDLDGALEVRTTFTYDEQGREIRQVRDDRADGRADWIRTRLHGLAGLLREEWDLEGDGWVDWRDEYVYDNDNRVLRLDRGACCDRLVNWTTSTLRHLRP